MYSCDKKGNAVNLPHISQRKHAFLVKTNEKATSNKIAPIDKVDLGFLHHILGHRSTISLMAGDTSNMWWDIELRIYPDPFFTSCQIKKAWSKNPLKLSNDFYGHYSSNIPKTFDK